MSRTTEMADGLRRLADWLDAHDGIIDTYDLCRLDLWPDNELLAYQQAKSLKDGAALGAVEKRWLDSLLVVRRMFGDYVRVDVNVHREQVCERVVVATETVEIPDPTFVAPTITVERDVTEWKCRPLLAGANGDPDDLADVTSGETQAHDA